MDNINKVYVIETNYSPDNNSFQSRLIYCDSWEEYISFFTNYDKKATRTLAGTLLGSSLPHNVTIENLQYDDEYLSCDIKLFNNNIKKRFAQKVDNLQTIVLNNISKGEC